MKVCLGDAFVYRTLFRFMTLLRSPKVARLICIVLRLTTCSHAIVSLSKSTARYLKYFGKYNADQVILVFKSTVE